MKGATATHRAATVKERTGHPGVRVMHQPGRVTRTLMAFLDPLPVGNGPQLPVDGCVRLVSRPRATLAEAISNAVENALAGL